MALGLFFDLTKPLITLTILLFLRRLIYGIRGTAHPWISSYLRGRTHLVEVSFFWSKGWPQLNELQWLEDPLELWPWTWPGLTIHKWPSLLTLPDDSAKICIFADDASFSVKGKNRSDFVTIAHKNTKKIVKWFQDNKLLVNNGNPQITDFAISDVTNHTSTGKWGNLSQLHHEIPWRILG